MRLISALQCEYKHMRQCKSGADGVRSGSRQELAQLPSPLLSYLFLSCSTPLPQALGNPNLSITCPQTEPLRTHLLLVSLLRGQHSCLLGCRNLGSFLSLLPPGPHLVCSIFHESPLEPFLVSVLDIPVHLLFLFIHFAVFHPGSNLSSSCLLLSH